MTTDERPRMTLFSIEEFNLVGHLIRSIERLADKRMPSRTDMLLERLVIATEGRLAENRERWERGNDKWDAIGARVSPGRGRGPLEGSSRSPYELRRKHTQGTCDRDICAFRFENGDHRAGVLCLHCNERAPVSKEANFCRTCSEDLSRPVAVEPLTIDAALREARAILHRLSPEDFQHAMDALFCERAMARAQEKPCERCNGVGYIEGGVRCDWCEAWVKKDETKP
jgi:hypothetical protein